MYTVIKSNVATITTTHEEFIGRNKYKSGDPARFDLMLKNLVAQRRMQTYLSPMRKNLDAMLKNFQFVDIKIGDKR